MITWNIPPKITQGDRVTWMQTLNGFDSDIDVLSCFVRGQNDGLDLTGTPTILTGWDFTIVETQSASLKPGKYQAQFVIIASIFGKKTLGSTDLIVLPSNDKVN